MPPGGVMVLSVSSAVARSSSVSKNGITITVPLASSASITSRLAGIPSGGPSRLPICSELSRMASGLDALPPGNAGVHQVDLSPRGFVSSTLTGANSSAPALRGGDGGPRRARPALRARLIERARAGERGRGARGARCARWWSARRGRCRRRSASARRAGAAARDRAGPARAAARRPRGRRGDGQRARRVYVERGGRIEPTGGALRVRGRADARDRAHPGAARPAGGRGVAAVRRAAARRLARERRDPAAVARRARASRSGASAAAGFSLRDLVANGTLPAAAGRASWRVASRPARRSS